MATNIQTLDALIRRRAEDDLRAKVHREVKGLHEYRKWLSEDDMAMTISPHDVQTLPDGAVRVNVRGVLAALEEHLVAANAQRVGDRAVEEFLQRVEDFQAEINEMRRTTDAEVSWHG